MEFATAQDRIPGRSTLRAELAVEDQDCLAFPARRLARTRLGRVRPIQEATFDVGELRQVNCPLDVTAFVLVIEATIDDDELFDPVAVHATLQLVQLSRRQEDLVNVELPASICRVG